MPISLDYFLLIRGVKFLGASSVFIDRISPVQTKTSNSKQLDPEETMRLHQISTSSQKQQEAARIPRE